MGTPINKKFEANFVKRRFAMSQFNRKSREKRLSKHANLARQGNKIFAFIYKRSYSFNRPALSGFTVNLIDTENWTSKFKEVDQNDMDLNVWKKVLKIPSKMILKRLDFRDMEIPNYEMFTPSSGLIFVVNFTLRENLIQNYTPTIIKCIVENALFIKSSYTIISTILNHKPVDSLSGIKRTLFQINSFIDQKYKVTLLQRNLETVLNEFLC